MTDPESNHLTPSPVLAKALQSTHCATAEEARFPSSNQGWRWWLLLLSIGLLSLGFRYYYLIHAQVLQPFYDQQHARADGVEYYAYAGNLVHHGVFSKSPEGTSPLVGDSYRDPGYPVFLAGWLKIYPQWDSWYPAVLLTQGVLSALSVMLALYMGRQWIPLKWLAGGGVLMALWPHNVSMSSFLLSESLFGFLCMLSLSLLTFGIQRRSVVWMGSSGIGFAFSALTNAVLLPFAPLLGLYLVYRRYITLQMFAWLMVGALTLPAAWASRNLALPPASGDSSAGRALDTLVIGSWPDFYETNKASLKNDPAAVSNLNQVVREAALINQDLTAGLIELAHRMGTHPLEYARWYLLKPALLWGWNIRVGQGDIYVYPTRKSPFEENVGYRAIAAVCHTLNHLIFVFMLLGWILALWPKQKAPGSLVASTLILAFITAVYTALQSEPRYSIAFRPLEILLATFSLYRAVFWLNHKIRPGSRSADQINQDALDP